VPLGNTIETVYSHEQNENASQARLACLAVFLTERNMRRLILLLTDTNTITTS
jgi:hypothetical protein